MPAAAGRLRSDERADLPFISIKISSWCDPDTEEDFGLQ